jgi:hypothetical protein
MTTSVEAAVEKVCVHRPALVDAAEGVKEKAASDANNSSVV